MLAQSGMSVFTEPRRRSKRAVMKENATIVGSFGCSLGGHARAATHTPKQLTKMARHAANCRWERRS